MTQVNTYSPQDVNLIISGFKVTGWDNITISKTNPSFTTVQGIRGKHTRVRNPDTSCSLVFNIIQTDRSNNTLSAIHDADLSQGTGKLSVMLKDDSGTSVFSSYDAYITTYPEVVFSGEFEYRQWTVFCQSVKDYRVGGNSKPKSVLDSLFSSF